jgi:hypothetical protein
VEKQQDAEAGADRHAVDHRRCRGKGHGRHRRLPTGADAKSAADYGIIIRHGPIGDHTTE